MSKTEVKEEYWNKVYRDKNNESNINIMRKDLEKVKQDLISHSEDISSCVKALEKLKLILVETNTKG